MEQPPPPPPPHGSNPRGGTRSGGLPDGRYDIFVIPPHSAGSGFLYLPSLQTQRNSFIAGAFCTALVFFMYYTAVPVIKEWFINTVHAGSTGVITLMFGVAVLAWAFGKTQSEWAQPTSSNGRGHGSGDHSRPGYAGYNANGPYSQPPPPPNHGTSGPAPQSSWQRPPPPQANTKANTSNAKSSWEKAREETRKREEERKRTEELKKRREELEKERQKQREKDAQERLERERKEKEKGAAAKTTAADHDRKAQAAKESPKRPPMPTARTERDDDAYSFRPYDRHKRAHKANSGASMYSESSYAPSESTARTTPPPTMRGPYTTKDPDKIIIKGVYSFNNAFMRTPISQLISGKGPVTDGLILRITTEGLFIDDDVRGVAQREWDVKAWTLKLAEVWCPNVPPGKIMDSPRRKFSLGFSADSRQQSSPSQNSSTAFVNKLLSVCQEECKTSPRWSSPSTHSSRSSLSTDATACEFTDTTSTTQSCELGGLHVLRASIRDQEGKKYVFVLSQTEGWKVAVGLQRLRRGSQVRALGVAGLPHNEAKAILESLGFA